MVISVLIAEVIKVKDEEKSKLSVGSLTEIYPTTNRIDTLLIDSE